MIKLRFNLKSRINIKDYILNLNTKFISQNGSNLKLTEKEIEIILCLGEKKSKHSLLEFSKIIQDKGAGEIILQSIIRDGTMEGYDLDLIKKISSNLEIPVVALGGAGQLNDLKLAFRESKASAIAAGSLFVYQSKLRGVLINYPEKEELKAI